MAHQDRDKMRDEVETLLRRGFRALEEGNLKLAFKMAGKLEELGHSACFELSALAHEEAGEPKQALRVLERGTAKAPGVWGLWQLLGNLYSDQDRFDEALNAYRKGLALEGADPSSLSYNLALALYRSGRIGEAREALAAVDGEETLLLRQALLVGVDLAEGKIQEAEERARSTILSTLEEEADPVALAALHVHLGEVLLARSARDEARDAGMRALEIDPVNHGAFALIREIDESVSDEAKSFELLLQGNLAAAPEVGFYKSYQVKAMDAEEALRKVMVFENLADPKSIQVEESEALAFDLGDRTGVYASSGYTFYDRD